MNKKEILDFCGGFFCCLGWLFMTYILILICA